MKRTSRVWKQSVRVVLTIVALLCLNAATVFAAEIGSAGDTPTNGAEASVTDAEKNAQEVLANATLKVIKNKWTYTGAAIKPEVQLIYKTETGSELDVTRLFQGASQATYQDNVAAGTAQASVTITGYYVLHTEEGDVFDLNAAVAAAESTDTTGQYLTFSENHTTTKQANFTISKASLSSLKLSKTSYTYNGTAFTPSTTVKASNGKTLKKNVDYKVTYANNKNAGTASVTVTATNANYTGMKKASFKIAKANFTKAKASLSSTKCTYTGKDRKPTAKVTFSLSSGKAALKKGRDYTVTYNKNCKTIGKKTVTIKGTGNYTGTLKKSYSIVPEKASGLKLSKRTTGALTVTCTKAKASGSRYQFALEQYNSKTKKWEEKTKKTSSNSYTFSGLEAGTVYHVKVRIYKSVDSKNYIGSWSNTLKTITTPSRTIMTSAVKTGSQAMKVTWKAVNAANGYEIQYSVNSNFASAKTIKVSGRTTTSKTISGLKSGATYYVRVRAYRTYQDKKYCGEWSSKQSTSWANVYAAYTTTYYSGNTNRSTNLRLACQAMNGKILADGDIFSFNAIVGERTAAKGYKEAIIYESGQEVGGIGGGICQVATTLFNAALKANFNIVERYQHSLTVHYVPLGYDAAIAWGSKNLRFQNNSGVSIKVSAVASGGVLKVQFLTNTYKKPASVTTQVTKRNGVYTLKRYVNGVCNYTTTSDYLDD